IGRQLADRLRPVEQEVERLGVPGPELGVAQELRRLPLLAPIEAPCDAREQPGELTHPVLNGAGLQLVLTWLGSHNYSLGGFKLFASTDQTVAHNATNEPSQITRTPRSPDAETDPLDDRPPPP